MIQSSDSRTYRQCAKEGCEALTKAGICDEAELQARQLMLYVCGMSPAEWLLKRDELISRENRERYEQVIEERCRRKPLQYITGEQGFMGLLFHVGDGVLIPRQDTEHLAEEALKHCDGKRVLDMCTGSGCIAISVALLGHPLSVTAADISEQALRIAADNGTRLGTDVTWVRSDMFSQVPGKFDLIVSNPPYIPPEQLAELEPEVREFEPRAALYGGEDGLDFYRILVAEGQKHLTPRTETENGGYMIVEIGFDQGHRVSELFLNAGFRDVRVSKDYAGLDRVVMGHL